jgi:uncharacterized membrane protein
MRLRSLTIGLLLGLGFTLVLNASSIRAFVDNRLTVADLGAEIGSADEAYYFAVIKDVQDGNWSMGNSSLYEYRTSPTVAGYGLLPQGILAAVTNWSIEVIVLLGDIVFPLLITCLVYLLAAQFLGDELVPALVSIAYMSWWSTLWQRTMNPQVTMLLFALALLGIVSDPLGKRLWLRGITAGALFLVQPMYAAYIFALEGVIAVYELWQQRSWKVVTRRIWMAVFVCAALLFQLWLQSGADALALADTYKRRGLIESHLPTGVAMQILIAILLGCVWLQRRKAKEKTWLVSLMLVAGLVVLNQSIIHGRDAVFGLYYRVPLSLVFWLSTAWLIQTLVRKKLQFILALLIAAHTVSGMLELMMTITIPRSEGRSEEFVRSDIPMLLSAIDAMPEGTIVAAPIEVSNLVPVLTTKHALFTQYAHFEYGTDADMAERYLTLGMMFPYPPEMTVEGDPLAFGIYAGNRAARVKSLCRIRSFFKDPCTQELALFLGHPELHTYLRTAKLNIPGELKKYGVTALVTDHTIQSDVMKFCKQPKEFGLYKLYSCSF